MLKVEESTWIISDTHFGHDNIVKHCNRPADHDIRMIKNWVSTVKKSDVILHLGDVTIWYKTYVTWAKVASMLPGKKYLIMGNHDEQWTPKEWNGLWGFKVIKPFRQNEIFFSHEASEDSGLWSVNVHGHSHQHHPFGYYEGLGRAYYNASIEGMAYSPVRMSRILEDIKKGQLRQE